MNSGVSRRKILAAVGGAGIAGAGIALTTDVIGALQEGEIHIRNETDKTHRIQVYVLNSGGKRIAGYFDNSVEPGDRQHADFTYRESSIERFHTRGVHEIVLESPTYGNQRLETRCESTADADVRRCPRPMVKIEIMLRRDGGRAIFL